jgi:hypothetical protein
MADPNVNTTSAAESSTSSTRKRGRLVGTLNKPDHNAGRKKKEDSKQSKLVGFVSRQTTDRQAEKSSNFEKVVENEVLHWFNIII